MPFKNPSAGTEIPYIDEGRYTAKLVRLDEREGTIDYGKGLQPHMAWVFFLQDSAGEVVLDARGLPQEWWVFTSQSLNERSTAKPIAEALLGKSIVEMSGDEVTAAVVGRKCSVMIADQIQADGVSVRSKAVGGSWKAIAAPAPVTPGAPKAPAPRSVAPPDDLASIPF